VLFEEEVREPKRAPRTVFLLAAGMGLLLGLGMLTRYAYGWLIIPVVAYLMIFGGPRRAAHCLLVVALFAVVVTPWLYRNMAVSGLPFGTSTLAIAEGSHIFPQYSLQRSLDPAFKQIFFTGFVSKLIVNTRTILQSELPRLGGSWLSLLFLVGLLLGFRNPAILRLRYFILMTLGTLIVVQALGRTQLSEDSPELNTENLLVLIVPAVFIYGVALFYMLLDQMNLPFRGFRFVVIGIFGVIMALPMVFAFLPPKPSPLAYPPYHPQIIRQVSGWMKENEMIMSDAPWAVAWYGQRQSIWLSPDTEDTFFAVNDFLKPVRGLYLTQLTMDGRFASEWVPRASAKTWGAFLLEGVLVRRSFPAGFPLREPSPGLLPQQFFLTDWKRWQDKPPDSLPPPPGSEPAKKEEKTEPAKTTP
jgi:hypothetical protein